MSVGERIKKRRKQLKLSVDELAKKLGKNRATIYRYESNDIENMPYEIVEPLAKALNVSPAYIMGWDEAENKTLSTNYPFLPVHVAAGLPEMVDPIKEKDVETISIPDAVMGKWAGRKDIYFMRVNGESMNKIIPNDSLIAVKKIDVRDLENGDIVVYSNHYEYSVKRFYKLDDRLVFKPCSTDIRFTDYNVPFDSCHELKIHGKVVLYIVNLD
jgi:repressor LexA